MDFFNILIILISLLLCLGLKRRPRKTRTAAYLERNPALYPGPVDPGENNSGTSLLMIGKCQMATRIGDEHYALSPCYPTIPDIHIDAVAYIQVSLPFFYTRHLLLEIS
jgi:hypothetical protein